MRHSSTLFSQPDGCGNHAPDRSQGFCRACGYEELIFTVRVSNLHLQFSTRDLNDKTEYTERYEYNEAGQQIRVYTTNGDGAFILNHEYLYTDTSSFKNIISYDIDGAVEYRLEYEYDQNGGLDAILRYDRAGKLVGREKIKNAEPISVSPAWTVATMLG